MVNMGAKGCDHVNNFVLFILAALFFLFCFSLQPRIATEEDLNDWDVLIYTQNWPNSVCVKWRTKNPNNTCNYPPNPDDWTIHGIWPTKFGTKGPWFCNTSLPFNMEELYGILPKLESQWTRVENHKKHSAFWKHEWDKHGTCAAELASLGTEFKYFFQGLVWNRSFNMSEILKMKGIEPSNGTVKAEQIVDAVKGILGKNPFVSCFTHPETKAVYLLEIRICFDKGLRLVNCDGIKSSSRRKYLNDYRYSNDFDGDNFFRSPISTRVDKLYSNLTDCPAGSNLLFPQYIPMEPAEPLEMRVAPLMNTYKLLNFIQWATL